jgi:hypothetical protein
LDYKGLSNAGTWFIGRLQTEQDKARLLDGLDNIVAGKGGYDREWADRLISDLDKRVFLLNNVHQEEPQVFRTRWAMAYLKGPITRDQIPALNALGARPADEAQEAVTPPGGPGEETSPPVGTEVIPRTPRDVDEIFLPNNLTVAQALKLVHRSSEGLSGGTLVYRPVLLAQASVRFLERKIDLDHEAFVTALIMDPDERRVSWEEGEAPYVDPDALDPGPAPEARFTDLAAPLNDAKALKDLQGDFLDYVYHSAELELLSNPELEIVATPGMPESEFQTQCTLAAREARDEAAEELQQKYAKKMERIRDKITREERELSEDQAELSARKMEEMATHAENVLSLFTGSRRRRVTTSLTKRRMTQKAKSDVQESQEIIEDLRRDLQELEDEVAEELDALDDHWESVAEGIETKVVTPYKKYIKLDIFGVAWHPYWRLESERGAIEAPAYHAGET